MILKFGNTEYQVEKLPETGTITYAYKLTGKRGAEYLLMRNQKNPSMLFAVNKNFTKSTPFDGLWFIEKDSTLTLNR